MTNARDNLMATLLEPIVKNSKARSIRAIRGVWFSDVVERYFLKRTITERRYLFQVFRTFHLSQTLNELRCSFPDKLTTGICMVQRRGLAGMRTALGE